MKSALLIIAQDGYQDRELAGTKQGLEAAGFTVTIASQSKGECRGKSGGSIEATEDVESVNLEQFSHVGFIGGPGMVPLVDTPAMVNLAKKAAGEQKKIGAICIAPLVLAHAGLLSGKEATVWDSQGEQIALLEASGAMYSGQNVTIDGNIITGNGPAAAEEFGQKFSIL